jgi:DNA replication initiation complex subunit (GINS family)
MDDYLMQENEEINYRNIRKIQQMEKSSSILTSIKISFYDDLIKYIDELDNLLKKETSSQKKRILEEEIKNTKKIAYNIYASQKKRILEEEIKNTKKIAYNIYEQREKKILLAAISKIRGGNPDLKNIIDIEKNLFDSISDILYELRKKIFEKNNKDHLVLKEQKKDIIIQPIKIQEKQTINKNPIIIINDDIPDFIGTDEKKYVLRKNDVLSIPKDMCDTLIKRGVAKKL